MVSGDYCGESWSDTYSVLSDNMSGCFVLVWEWTDCASVVVLSGASLLLESHVVHP